MLKLAHACTYSFYGIENRVNNSIHDIWVYFESAFGGELRTIKFF